MGEIQIPFGAVSSAAADLADRENDLVNYFLGIDTQPIATVVARACGGRGPRGYGVSLVLSRILKVKQVFISDRILAQRLKEVATYRRLCGSPTGRSQLITRTLLSEGPWVLQGMPRSMQALFAVPMPSTCLTQSCRCFPRIDARALL